MIFRTICFLALLLSPFSSQAKNAVVVDSITGQPLAGAPVFNIKGKLIGTAFEDGTLPHLLSSDLPVTVKYMGYLDHHLSSFSDSLVRMREAAFDLPEVVTDSRDNSVLHLLGFVRDYSTLTSYKDTITLFREKWIDFMVPGSKVRRFAGWRSPRILKSQSYYHFTNEDGLDSVSDRSNFHFSWADWVTIVDRVSLPPVLSRCESGTDTVFGRYSPSEIWSKKGDRVRVRINVLSDTVNRRWVRNLSSFFRDEIDFEKFTISYDFRDVIGETTSSRDLTHITCNIESRGRGHNMFGFMRHDEPFFVTTYTEVYIIDQEYLTVADAKRWERYNLKGFDPALPYGLVPEVSEHTARLMARVGGIDHDARRARIKADPRIGYRKERPPLPKNKILRFLRKILG